MLRSVPVNVVTLGVDWELPSKCEGNDREGERPEFLLGEWGEGKKKISRLSQKRFFSHTYTLLHPCPAFFSSNKHTHTDLCLCVCGCWAVPHVLGVSHQIRLHWQKGLLHTGGRCGCKRWSQPPLPPPPTPNIKKKIEKQLLSKPASQRTNQSSWLTDGAATSAATCECVCVCMCLCDVWIDGAYFVSL